MNQCLCGAKVKANAITCPECGARLLGRFTRTFSCKQCGERLIRGDHLLRGYRSPVADGGSRMSGFYHQRPCVACGEPRPYPDNRILLDRGLQLLGLVVAAALAVAGLRALLAG